jgi:hypothetical protein
MIAGETKSESLTDNLMQKTEPCRGDSVDSVICAWGTGRLRRRLDSLETMDDDDTVDSERREPDANARNQREESDREAGEKDSAMKVKLTLLTLPYAHAVFSFECERSIELREFDRGSTDI